MDFETEARNKGKETDRNCSDIKNEIKPKKFRPHPK